MGQSEREEQMHESQIGFSGTVCHSERESGALSTVMGTILVVVCERHSPGNSLHKKRIFIGSHDLKASGH